MALVLGYYNKKNLGDEQYKIVIPPLLVKSGFRDSVRFENPHDIDCIPPHTKILICGGGDIVNEWFQEKMNALIKGFRGPVIALSIGITYPSTITFDYLGFYNKIVLRHRELQDEVASVIGSSNVLSIPDVGFLLPQQTPVRNFPKPRVGVFLATGACTQANLATIKSALAAIPSTYEVVCYTMNYSDEEHEGDHFTNAQLGFNEAHRITSVQQMQANIGGLALAICVRYHAHVFAIIQGTPFVSLALTPKTMYLMADNNFTSNVALSVAALPGCISYALANLTTLRTQVTSVYNSIKSSLSNFVIPGIERSLETLATECTEMLTAGCSPSTVAAYALIHLTGTSNNKYTYGFVQDLTNRSSPNAPSILDMLKFIKEDSRVIVKGLKFLQTVESFSGLHRSGWEAACKILKSLEIPNGTLCDLYVDGSFHWNHDDLSAKGVIPYRQKWVGFIHHTPLENYTKYNTAALFEVDAFRDSLPFCVALIVLSNTLAAWVKRKLVELGYKNIEVQVVKHPTEIPSLKFNLRAWLDNPTITQVGAWMRNPYSIYALHLPWGTKQVLEGPKMDSYIHPDTWYLANTLNCPSTPAPSGASASSCCMCRGNDPGHSVMMTYMNLYIHTVLGAPSFIEVRVGTPCCPNATTYPSNWATKIACIAATLTKNYESVTRISNLPNNEYDELLSTTVVFLNMLDCSAANTIVECAVRGTPLIVNKLPAIQEYLGVSYPGYYTDLTSVWRIINPSNIYKIHSFLAKMDNTPLMLDQFLKKVEAQLLTLL